MKDTDSSSSVINDIQENWLTKAVVVGGVVFVCRQNGTEYFGSL